MADERLDLDVLRRYLAGTCTPAEADAVHAWILADPDAAAFIDGIRLVVRPPPAAEHAWRTDERWQQLVADTPGLARPTPLRRRAPFASPGGFLRPARAALAAGLLVAVSLGVGVVVRSHRAARVYTTAVGEREAITLTDGTRITLAPGSRLQLAADYGRATRNMTLDGEALFEVVHDPARPFRVQSGHTVTEDAGTRFAVRAWRNEPTVRVAVADGVVLLRDRNRSLRGGDIAVVTDTAVTVTPDADVDAATAFATGRLVFADEPLHDVLVDIARWYGVTVTLTDPGVGDRTVRGTFDAAPLSVVLDAITGAVGVRWVRAGDAVAIVANSR